MEKPLHFSRRRHLNTLAAPLFDSRPKQFYGTKAGIYPGLQRLPGFSLLRFILQIIRSMWRRAMPRTAVFCTQGHIHPLPHPHRDIPAATPKYFILFCLFPDGSENANKTPVHEVARSVEYQQYQPGETLSLCGKKWTFHSVFNP